MDRQEPLTILTIGHSTHPYDRFLSHLRAASVSAIADVRSAPFSRHQSQYNRNDLQEQLRRDGISYVFLGRELGGRPSQPEYYSNGIADYEKMVNAPTFEKGIDRLIEGANRYRIAIMCSEQDPLECHRFLLVGRALAKRGITLSHILPDGCAVTQGEAEERLLEICGRASDDLFAPRAERLAMSYRERALKVAFAELQADAQDRDVAE
jgi:uncharacterized protein (DUF488 family)